MSAGEAASSQSSSTVRQHGHQDSDFDLFLDGLLADYSTIDAAAVQEEHNSLQCSSMAVEQPLMAMEQFLASASESASKPRAPPLYSCWGAELKCSDLTCVAGFKSGKAHFKNKFCARCREGIEVPVARVRALTSEQQQHVFNSLQSGFWKRAPLAMGGGEVRIANNTITCDGPWLAVFRESPPSIPWEPVPQRWVYDGVVRLSVAKGTLVPAAELYSSRRAWVGFVSNVAKRRRRLGPRAEASAEASEGEDGGAAAASSSCSAMDTAPSGSTSACSSGPGQPESLIGSQHMPAGSHNSHCTSPVLVPTGSSSSVTLCADLLAAHQGVIGVLERGLTLPEVSKEVRSMLEEQLRLSQSAVNEVLQISGLASQQAVASLPFSLPLSRVPYTGQGASSSGGAGSSAASTVSDTTNDSEAAARPTPLASISEAGSSETVAPASIRRSSTEVQLPTSGLSKTASMGSVQQRGRFPRPTLSRSFTLPTFGAEKKDKKHYSETLGSLTSLGSSDSKILSPRLRRNTLTESFRRLFLASGSASG